MFEVSPLNLTIMNIFAIIGIIAIIPFVLDILLAALTWIGVFISSSNK